MFSRLLLATGLLLSTLGCSKKDFPPIPPPALEGSWNYTQEVTTTNPGAGAATYQTTRAYPLDNTRSARYLTFTSTTQQVFYGDGTALSAVVSFTRAGNTLNYLTPSSPPPPVQITQLTATELTLLYTTEGLLQGSYSNVEAHYTRR